MTISAIRTTVRREAAVDLPGVTLPDLAGVPMTPTRVVAVTTGGEGRPRLSELRINGTPAYVREDLLPYDPGFRSLELDAQARPVLLGDPAVAAWLAPLLDELLDA